MPVYAPVSPAVTKKVSGQLLDGSGNGVAGIVVAKMLSLTYVNAGEVVPREVRAIAAADGTYSFDPAAAVPNGLFSNADLTPANTYWSITEVANGVPYTPFGIVVPNSAGPFVMNTLVVSSPALPAQYVTAPAVTSMPSTAITGLAGVLASPRPPTIVLLGDSITENNGNSEQADAPTQIKGPHMRSNGFWTWAAQRLGYRLIVTHNFGDAGDSSAQILGRVTSVTSLSPKPGWCLVNAGTNDFGVPLTTAQTVANITAICNTILAAGIGVILTTLPPSNFYPTTQPETIRLLRLYAQATAGVLFVDWYPYITDPSNGFYLPNMSSDGVHPNTAGAKAMGDALYNVLSVAIPPFPVAGSGSNVDSLSLIPNPTLNGTGGTLGLSAGSLAANWVSRMGVNATFSKVPRTDGILGDWQQVVLASPGSSNSDMYVLYTAPSGAAVIQAGIEYQVDPGATGVTSFALALSTGGGALIATVNHNVADTGIQITNEIVTLPPSGVMMTIPAPCVEAVGYAVIQVAATSGTFRFGRAFVKRVA